VSRPGDFQRIVLSEADEAVARSEATFNPDNPFAWVGLAAEHALAGAINRARHVHGLKAWRPDTFEHDLEIAPGASDGTTGVHRVEVKCRVASRGWTDPGRFEWIAVPTHSGREPIKAVDLVVFCWWSADEPRRLWVLGRLLGPEEFKRRAQFYREGEPTPRGGPAPKGGTWVLDVAALRPMPRGFLDTEE
jgi:hypothetical protein